MQRHCGGLQRSLPSLSAAADAFAHRASDLASQRAANKQLLSAFPLVVGKGDENGDDDGDADNDNDDDDGEDHNDKVVDAGYL